VAPAGRLVVVNVTVFGEGEDDRLQGVGVHAAKVCADCSVSVTVRLDAAIVPELVTLMRYTIWSPGLAVMLVLVQVGVAAAQTNLLADNVVVVGVAVTVTVVAFDVPVAGAVEEAVAAFVIVPLNPVSTVALR
jgi:hypothetical protein